MLHENRGAAFQRADGTTVLKGDVFEPTARELRQWAHKLRPAEVGARSMHPADFAHLGSVPDAPAAALPGAAEQALVPAWPMTMVPARYLELYPDGPHAEQARALTQQDAEASTDAGE